MTKYNEISKPEHYNHGNYEVLDIIKDQLVGMPISPWEGYLLGNIIKYLLRFPYKGKSEQDLGKAKYYLSCLINEYDLKAGYSDEDIKGFMATVANADKEYDDAANYRASKAKEGNKDVKDDDSDVSYGSVPKEEKGVKDVKDDDSDVSYGHSSKKEKGVKSYDSVLSILKYLTDTVTIKDLEDYIDDKKDKDDSVEDNHSSFVLKPKTISTLKKMLENNNSTSNAFVGFDLSYNRKNLIDLLHDLKADEYEDVLFDELVAEVLDVASVAEWAEDSTESYVVQLLFEDLTTSILSDLQDYLIEE